MIKYLIAGIVFGLSAGVAPGPLLTLVISETLRHNINAGIKVSLAPLITDLPIILLTLFFLVELYHFHVVLGAISIIGGFFVFYLGCESIRTRGVSLSLKTVPPRSMQKGIFVNIFSPHPYLFWFSVGSPTIVKAFDISPIAAASFICTFYISLIGSKVFIAIATGKSRSFLCGKTYVYTMRILGMLLLLFAIVLFLDGLKLLFRSS